MGNAYAVSHQVLLHLCNMACVCNLRDFREREQVMDDDSLLISERNMPQASFQAQQTCTSAGHYGYGSHAHDFVELMSGASHTFADLQLRVDTT